MTGFTRQYRLGMIVMVLATGLLLGSTSAWSAQPDYTKGDKPTEKRSKWAIGSTGAFGYIHYSNGRQILITDSVKGSPADGKLKEGDVILGVVAPKAGQNTGTGRFTMEARHSLAIAIEEAEKAANAGKLVLTVWRSGRIKPVSLKLKVMGSYGSTAPWKCTKTAAIINTTATVISKKNYGGRNGEGASQCLDMLGLLATGEEKYLPKVREFIYRISPKLAELDVMSPDKKKNVGVWHGAYQGVLIAEYYLLTKDEKVVPGIKGIATYLSKGISGVGTWSHGIANVRLNGPYGPSCAYGAMNQAGMVAALSLVLAQKCGIKEPVVDDAVRRALDFLRYYVDKGCIPYGDHEPRLSHDNNGRMSIGAVLFDLAGQKKEADYFTRMTIASHNNREVGHTGHFFAWQWGALGAARGGPAAAQNFIKNTHWFVEMERRHDGSYVYQPQLRRESGKYGKWSTSGSRLMQHCLPRKALYITGKGSSVVTPVGDDELKQLEGAGRYSPKGRSVEQLLADLGQGSLVVRDKVGRELGTRDDDVVEELIAMLDSPRRFARYGACAGLRYAGRKSKKAVAALVAKIQSDPDFTMRYFSVGSLMRPSNKDVETGAYANGLGNAAKEAIPALFKAATVNDLEQDATRKLQGQIAYALLSKHAGLLVDSRGRLHEDTVKRLDKGLLRGALESWLTNPNGGVRSTASAVFAHLDQSDLDVLWGTIYQATTTSAPSGVMFSGGVRVDGIRLMGEYKVKEGMAHGAWYCTTKRGWGTWGRRQKGIPAFLAYGRAAEPYLPDVEKVVQGWKGKKGMSNKVKGVNKAIANAKKQSRPQVISIKKYIKTKPEKAFLEWKALKGVK